LLTGCSNNHIQDVLVISYLANTIRTQIDLSNRLATAALTLGPEGGAGGEGGEKKGGDQRRGKDRRNQQNRTNNANTNANTNNAE
jgi:translation initiation factor 3 subunit F